MIASTSATHKTSMDQEPQQLTFPKSWCSPPPQRRNILLTTLCVCFGVTFAVFLVGCVRTLFSHRSYQTVPLPMVSFQHVKSSFNSQYAAGFGGNKHTPIILSIVGFSLSILFLAFIIVIVRCFNKNKLTRKNGFPPENIELQTKTPLVTGSVDERKGYEMPFLRDNDLPDLVEYTPTSMAIRPSKVFRHSKKRETKDSTPKHFSRMSDLEYIDATPKHNSRLSYK